MANNFPTIKPTLNLQLANTGTLPPDVTFTRASSSGGYYDGKTVAKAEENLLLHSEEFDNASWSKQNATVTANSTISPNGASTADTLVENTANTVHNIRKFNYTVLASTTYAASVFVKPNGRSIVYIDMTRVGVTNHRTWFDLSGSGSVLTSDAGNTGAITSVGNGWYRISVTRTTVAGQTAQTFEFGPATADNATVYTGDGTSGIFIWGAQLEQRSSVTAYTPTTTQPITNFVPKLLFAPANVPVFDHNPTTGEALGLSVFEARTNLLLRSQEFENAAWLSVGVSRAADVLIAPDGTLTADKITETTAAGNHIVYTAANVSLTSGTSYTISLFVKAAERSLIRFASAATSRVPAATFNLSTLAITSLGSGTTATINPVGNGWYRITATRSAPSTGTDLPSILIINNSGQESYTGDGTSGIYIWGAQLEAGAFATPYIPTVASTVARSADVAVMTGVNFTRWYRADEGALVVEGVSYGGSQAGYAAISDGTTTNQIDIRIASAVRRSFVVAGTDQANISNGAYVAGDIEKRGIAYAFNDVSAAAQGSLGTPDTVAVLPVVNRLTLGSLGGGAQILNGQLKSLSYYPARLTNAQLQAVTA